ncbi:MAG TPA: glycogen debranching protein, partial [Actinomycetota bacterium]|nr:glycogen debranching protein [Actinomycetota bacterium]
SLIAAGLRRYGHHDAAARIAEATVRAAGYFDHRLPEVFAGYDEQLTHTPVAYPTASSPQAWATGAPFLWFRIALGLKPKAGELVIDPMVPEDLDRVGLKGVHGAGSRWELWAKGTEGEITRMS